MKLTRILFLPEGHVVFTEAEIALLVECSTLHYDAACKNVSQAGGFLRGIQTRAKHSAGLPYTLTHGDLDLLSKVLEVGVSLGAEKAKMAAALRTEIRQTYLRMSEHTPEPKTLE